MYKVIFYFYEIQELQLTTAWFHSNNCIKEYLQ